MYKCFLHIFCLFPAAPRFRNSIAGATPESCRTAKRPHSVISVSSVSSSSTSSGGSGGQSASQGHSSIGFESNYESPKPYRSATLNSQCPVGKNSYFFTCYIKIDIIKFPQNK